MDYLTGKLPDQTEVEIRTQVTPDSKSCHDQHITFVYNWQKILHLYEKVSSVTQLTSGANVFRRVFVPKDDILNI